MNTIDIYKDRNDNYYVQAGDYKVRIADGTRHDGTTISHFELVKILTIPAIVGQSEQLVCDCQGCGEEKKIEYCEKCYAENLPDIAN